MIRPVTFLGGAEQVEHALEPPQLHVQREGRQDGQVQPHVPEELLAQRRGAGHREVRPVPEVRRRLPGEERRHERKLQRLRCNKGQGQVVLTSASGDRSSAEWMN
jgi:hypothetical protein